MEKWGLDRGKGVGRIGRMEQDEPHDQFEDDDYGGGIYEMSRIGSPHEPLLTDKQIRDAWTLWNLAFAEKGQKLNGKS